MKIKELEIENVRNLERAKIDFSKDLVLVYGKNAQGKTNLLESIYFLAITKSPRKGKEKDIVNEERKQARISGKFIKKNKEELNVEFLIGSKKIGKLNTNVEKFRSIVGEVLVVLFTVDDLGIIENPQKRRRFADILISFLDKSYFVNLIDFKAAIKRRNSLLSLIKKKEAGIDELAFWDEKTSALSEKIVKERKKIFKNIDNHLGKSKFLGDKRIHLEYSPKAEKKEDFRKLLLKNQERDIILGQTSIGPHRDEIGFFIDGLNLDTHGSRGEKRSVVVELKKAEIDIIEEALEEKPVLLLDDVFSELDKENKEHVLSLVLGQQTILTTTNQKDLGKYFEKAKVYKIEEGKVLKG